MNSSWRCRRNHKLCFWFVFPLAPAAVVAGLLPEFEYHFMPEPWQRFLSATAPVILLAFGALVCGYCLGRAYPKPDTALGIFTGTILFTFGVGLAYLLFFAVVTILHPPAFG